MTPASKAPSPQPNRLAVSPYGMVSTAHEAATEAGREMLAAGGNAMDAAVAAAFALGVCEPQASGIGGQTMMLVHDVAHRRTFALDGSSRAPNRATPDQLSPHDRLRGYRSTTVPSTPAVLDYALRRYGTLPLDRILEPAIRLADEGFAVGELLHSLIRRERKAIRKGNIASVFLSERGRAWPIGSTLRQPALAETLRRLARNGISDFYRGEIAAEIVADVEANWGLLRADDLANVPLPIERRPVTTRFDGARVFTMPPPGAGRALVEILNVLSQFSAEERDPDTVEGGLLLADIVQRANVDREDRPFEANFYPQVRNRKMVEKRYAAEIASELRSQTQTRDRTVHHGETTHLSVMDQHGNAVALTQSIERVFGAAVATPSLGFLYNDYLSTFEVGEITHPYYLRPNGVPWASVTPSILFRGQKPWLAIGSPGSARIASAVSQVLLRLSLQAPVDAVAAPRLHCSSDGRVSLEAERMPGGLVEALEQRGFEIDVREPWSFYLGCVQLVLRAGNEFVGVADPRRDGSAAGLDRRPPRVEKGSGA